MENTNVPIIHNDRIYGCCLFLKKTYLSKCSLILWNSLRAKFWPMCMLRNSVFSPSIYCLTVWGSKLKILGSEKILYISFRFEFGMIIISHFENIFNLITVKFYLLFITFFFWGIITFPRIIDSVRIFKNQTIMISWSSKGH